MKASQTHITVNALIAGADKKKRRNKTQIIPLNSHRAEYDGNEISQTNVFKCT